ncbi:hypothetical protein AVEN_182662-1 [Araneus ventricosus]|uniref:Uncharacterized protein n=1 Tax=Araneus ventricosus TaxID=182803 RepID=A0A4Y2HIM2_ARAVE|nr:hypothetical protein AVEN_182662-1 [Araneus ventricosus]
MRIISKVRSQFQRLSLKFGNPGIWIRKKWRILHISKARLKMYLQLRPIVAARNKRDLTSSNSTGSAVEPTGVSSKPLSRKHPS